MLLLRRDISSVELYTPRLWVQSSFPLLMGPTGDGDADGNPTTSRFEDLFVDPIPAETFELIGVSFNTDYNGSNRTIREVMNNSGNADPLSLIGMNYAVLDREKRLTLCTALK
ncbi:hypothetical protein DY000_02040157 [Brassica cretica]|uniref:Legume lectin domain-containing protein n=1 Tax=Brassica cretica TaxID=69181 RepID=A0ABQ7BGS2_BRACR|nr:hypothetical protein DY000_02040157 [Brassica cretica]